jgi:ArsR family transcriptional regulator, arsenate/arsenite/antimonite-responsive transcriptional repressor
MVIDRESMALTDMSLPLACCAPLAQPTITSDEAEATATLFKALADPHRVRIVNMLATSTEPVCVCEITDSMDVAQPTISFHLKKLVSAGLLEREQRGTWAYYSLKDDALARLGSVVQTGRTS